MKRIHAVFWISILSLSVEAQKIRQIKEADGSVNCVLQDRAYCKNMTFKPQHNLSRARARQGNFENSKFLGRSWNGKEYVDFRSADLKLARFQKAQLNFVDLGGSNLEGANFSGATLERVNLGYVLGKSSNFSDKAKLEFVAIKDANFDRVNFSGATLKDVTMSGIVTMHDSDFGESIIDKVTFEGVELNQSNFEKAQISNTKFTRANLEGANFRCATFKGVVDFTGADLERVDLTAAKLGAMEGQSSQKLLAGHYCGTEIGDGVYRSDEGQSCTIPDGTAPSADFCK